MSDDLRNQVRNNLELKDTEDLLALWQANDRAAWSDTTFELVEEILRERLGEVPPQNAPVEVQEPVRKTSSEGLEAWQEKLLDDENQPEYYDPVEVVTLVNTINTVALASIVLNVVVGLLSFGRYRDMAASLLVSPENILSSLIAFIAIVIDVGLKIIFTYFPLKALAYVLRVLAEMELNSRKV